MLSPFNPFRWPALALAASLAWAQTPTLESELRREAFAYLDARQTRVNALRTQDEIGGRQRDVRTRFLQGIGGLAGEKTPLNAKVTGGFSRPGYRVENVVFESQPGFRVTANLYVPSGQGPFPAVLGAAGHSVNGKASATYQHAWIGLVRRGYVVLAYDPPGQGERLEFYDPDSGRSRVGAGVPEHIMAGLQCLLTGTSIARYFIWDGIRAFDYLAARPEVDATRIAVAGNSGGGTQAAFLSVADSRLAAVVSSCYMTSWRELWDAPGPQDSEQVIPGFLSSGLDFPDFALAGVPRPFLLTAAVRDFFPILGARSTYQEIVRVYERWGSSERAGYFDFEDTHGWSKPRREAAYRFLDRWLLDRQTDGAEPAIEIEPESRLWATSTGQLSTSVGSETIQSLNATRLAGLAASRGPFSPERVKARLQVTWSPTTLPARPGKPAILTLGASADDMQSLLRAGWIVVPVEARGLNLAPRRDAGGYNPTYQLSARTWLLGRSLASYQVEDTLRTFQTVIARPDVDPRQVALFAHGVSGPVALMAAVLEPGIAKVAVEGSFVSYHDLVASRIHRGWDAAVIPGVLRDFDLPDLVRACSPRQVWLVSPVRPNGSPYLPLPLFEGAQVVERPEAVEFIKAYRTWLTR